ncbi:MBL fold metallo-hydrolase [Streptomyces sp. NPDC056987]|uniref:MBL fold metallo-hydrolase n=1 Tax=Streptomyces sp. NPDC056987 TaxID=3345988 RepID=UPI00362D3AFA
MATEQWEIGDVTVTKIEEVAFWAPMDESFNGLRTDFLERFSKVWDPADVDGVICTHLHTDHVGWNTRLVDGAWAPTFPNATYHCVREEFEFWKGYAKTDGSGTSYSEFACTMMDGPAVFNDSVRPIADAGLVGFVDPDSELTPEVSLVPSFGHTPHHVAVRIESKNESAEITGDLMHYPCQVTRPDWSAEFDFDKHASAETRDALVKQYADTGTLILSAHFGTPTGGHIVSDGDAKALPDGMTV